MLTVAQRYNLMKMQRDEIRPEHMEELIRFFQLAVGLKVDGMLGPKTRALLMDEAPPNGAATRKEN